MKTSDKLTVLAPLHGGSRFWPWMRRLILGVALAGTLPVLFYAIENWRGDLAWTRIKAELSAKGNPTSIPGTAPAVVPDAENLAQAPLFARAFTFGRDPETGEWLNYDPSSANRLATVQMLPRYSRIKPPNIGSWWRGERLDLRLWQEYFRQLAVTNSSSEPHGTKTVSSSSANPSDYQIPADLAARYGLATTNPTPAEFNKLFSYPVPTVAGSPAGDVLQGLAKLGVELDRLGAEADHRLLSRFAITYDREPAAGILLPHLARLKGLTQVLRLRSLARLGNDETDGALKDVLLGMRLAEMPADEIFMVSHLVRAADWMIILQPVWEGLQNRQWSDSQLATLIARLRGSDLLSGVSRIYLAESLLMASRPTTEVRKELVELIDPKNNHYQSGAASLWEDWGFTRMKLLHGPRGWFYQNAARHMRRMQDELARFLSWKDSPGITNFILSRPVPPSSRISSFELILNADAASAIRQGVSKLIRADAYRRLALTACALERHRLAHGNYPATLAALVPQFLDRVPADPASGGSLSFQPVDGGTFRLYSVGPDGRDDRGQIEGETKSEVEFWKGDSPESHLGEDWVWPESSTKEATAASTE